MPAQPLRISAASKTAAADRPGLMSETSGTFRTSDAAGDDAARELEQLRRRCAQPPVGLTVVGGQGDIPF